MSRWIRRKKATPSQKDQKHIHPKVKGESEGEGEITKGPCKELRSLQAQKDIHASAIPEEWWCSNVQQEIPSVNSGRDL